MSTKVWQVNGNDTIDPYPLFCWGAKKILIVKTDIFEELRKRYEMFCQSLAPRPVKKNTAPNKERDSKRRIFETHRENFLSYQPSNALAVNECDYRRWCRVNEWFAEFGPDTKESKGVCFDSIKMDT